jgi:hypothetical protein
MSVVGWFYSVFGMIGYMCVEYDGGEEEEEEEEEDVIIA